MATASFHAAPVALALLAGGAAVWLASSHALTPSGGMQPPYGDMSTRPRRPGGGAAAAAYCSGAVASSGAAHASRQTLTVGLVRIARLRCGCIPATGSCSR